MDVKNVEKKDNGKLTFQVEVDAAAFESAVNKAYIKAKKNIYVPGFRKGKAPRMVIEGMYGAAVFHDDAVSDIAPDAYEQGVKQADVRTVGRPTITDYSVGEDKSLTIDFSVTLYPEATLGQYKGLEVYKETVVVADSEVDAELERVQKRSARIINVERGAAEGDTVNIDYDGYKDGVRFDGGKAEGQDLVLGSNHFVPSFEEQLVGAKAGEERELNITFPEDYHEGLAGADVVFKVKVNEVRESQLPELDDDFAKDVSEFDTLAEYKEDIKKNLLAAKQENADKAFRTAALDEAIENMSVEVPDEMLQEQLDGMVDEYKQNVVMSGMNFEQYLSMMGMDEQRFRSVLAPSADRQARGDILLEAVAKAEGIEPTGEEIENEYKAGAENYKVSLDEVRAAIPEELIKRDLRLRKAADLICDSAVITDKKPEPEQAEEEKPVKKTRKKAEKKTEAAAGEKPAEEKPKRTRKKAAEKPADAE